MLCVQSVCTLHVTLVSLPVPPEALISCWSHQNWMKDVARGLLGPGLGPAAARRASLDTSLSIKFQTHSKTRSIPTALEIISLQKRQVLFISLQLRQGYG